MEFMTVEQRTARRLVEGQRAALRGRVQTEAFASRGSRDGELLDALWTIEWLLGDLVTFIELGRMGTDHVLVPF